MAARNYSSVARATTLTSSVSGSSTVFTVTETTGFPAVPFTLVVDPARSTEEAVTVTAQVGLSLTVIRGEDGTGAVPHDAGATVRHMATARDFREPAEHIDLTSGIHGIAGELVGLTDTQVLDNKTFTPVGTDHVPVRLQAAVSQTANALDVVSSGGTVLASVKTSGRIATPGIDGSDTSTFTPAAAATVPLIVKGAPAQTAKLISVRDNASIELASIAADGTLAARSTTVSGDLTVSEEITSPDLVVTDSTVLATANIATPTVVVRTPAGQTAQPLSVRTVADVSVAGVLGESGGYQMFHGGSASNRLPFRIHGGAVNNTMPVGASSISGTIDIAPYGYDVNPFVMLTVRQGNESTLKRRVCVNVENISTVTITYRIIQTADQVMPDDTNYTVEWMAIQMLPSAAAG